MNQSRNKETCVLLLCNFRINKKNDQLAPLSLEHQITLRETLIENCIYLLSSLENKANFYFIAHALDKSFLEKALIPDYYQKALIEFENGWNSIKQIIERDNLTESSRYLIVFGNSIGYDLEKLSYILNLLENDDQNVVIFKSYNNKVSIIGFNHMPIVFFESMPFMNLFYDDTLAVINKSKNFLFSLNGSINVDNFEDFSYLFKFLRTKQSKKFCPDNIYDKFTDLFIEYKEYLQQ